MIGSIVLFLLGIGCFAISAYVKPLLSFEGNTADYVLLWAPIAVGVILLLIGIGRLEAEYGFLSALFDKRDTKQAGAQKKPQKKPNEKKKYTKNPAWTFKASGASDTVGTMALVFVGATVVIAIACYVMFMLTAIGKFHGPLHWIPIAAAALFYLVIFAIFYSLNEDNRVFKHVYPHGKTREEVRVALAKVLRETGYAYYHLKVVRWSALCFILQAGIAALITPSGLNFLAATPMILIISLIHHRPESAGDITSSFIAKRMGDDWSQHLCKKCGAILGKYHVPDSTAETGKSQSIGSEAYRVTDEYTDGYNTLRVHRTEKEYYVKTNTSYHSTYSCPRCKNRWSEDKSYSEKKYL
ncbi:MAG: hypothetical protein E7644_00015 [Ruminococcaceae bacterium]|nr:hypothetical protein [Oscillospiraceae bacterium]